MYGQVSLNPNTISLSAEAGDSAAERGGAQHGEHCGRGQGQDLGSHQEGVGLLQPGLQVADTGECPRDQVACIASNELFNNLLFQWVWIWSEFDEPKIGFLQQPEQRDPLRGWGGVPQGGAAPAQAARGVQHSHGLPLRSLLIWRQVRICLLLSHYRLVLIPLVILRHCHCQGHIWTQK